ncbi:MAG: hypothetical protein JWR61_5655 [Ferruginibacter sp.]|uniref:hypothetical protein n=1 Tax=Ferruginibacter sp. TaxID=1940288 RepID=UPI002658B0B3|nr:hypothetical protein [Ferruginibacter sp.]MDB5280700.1 hypothetical protein [Ferruginibacter sp.]
MLEKQKNKAEARNAENKNPLFFEEWEMRCVHFREGETGKIRFEKLKRLRARVVISPEEANTLNTMVEHGQNTFVSLYLVPGEKDIFTMDEIDYSSLQKQ